MTDKASACHLVAHQAEMPAFTAESLEMRLLLCLQAVVVCALCRSGLPEQDPPSHGTLR